MRKFINNLTAIENLKNIFATFEELVKKSKDETSTLINEADELIIKAYNLNGILLKIKNNSLYNDLFSDESLIDEFEFLTSETSLNQIMLGIRSQPRVREVLEEANRNKFLRKIKLIIFTWYWQNYYKYAISKIEIRGNYSKISSIFWFRSKNS